MRAWQKEKGEKVQDSSTSTECSNETCRNQPESAIFEGVQSNFLTHNGPPLRDSGRSLLAHSGNNRGSKSFQKSLIKGYTLNHKGILVLWFRVHSLVKGLLEVPG